MEVSAYEVVKSLDAVVENSHIVDGSENAKEFWNNTFFMIYVTYLLGYLFCPGMNFWNGNSGM